MNYYKFIALSNLSSQTHKIYLCKIYVISQISMYIMYKYVVYNVLYILTEHLVVDPDTPSIINGGAMTLSGPCFNANNEVITCTFYNATEKEVHDKPINGIITINDQGNEKAICPIPFFKTLGGHSVVITVDNNKKYRGSFTVGEYKIHNYNVHTVATVSSYIHHTCLQCMAIIHNSSYM